MSCPPVVAERPVAAIFRTPLFNPTEGFIQDQAAALGRWRPLIVGLEQKGEVLPALRNSMILPAGQAERLLFGLRGRGGTIETRLREADPALIHAHFGPDGLLVLPLARALGLPLVTTLHGYDVGRSNASLLLSGNASWVRYALCRRRLAKGGRLFIAVSDAVRQKAITRGFPPERIRTHYNGINLNRFHPDQGPREPGLVLHVGRLVEKKGTGTLIAALAGAKDARLVVLGDGPLRGALERQAREAGVEAQFLGSVTPDAVITWMRRAALLAAPSITAADGDMEGLPTVVVEAAASGLPVVATHHSGIPEAVENGRSGFLVPESDADALGARIGEVLGSAGLRRDMGAAARALAVERFDRVRLNVRLEAIYDEVTHS